MTQEKHPARTGIVTTKAGIGLGGVVAAVMSFVVNKSVFWCFVHLFFSWFYVAYCCCAHSSELDAFIHENAGGR